MSHGMANVFDLRRVAGAVISLGQKLMATSIPVTIASDQSAIPVSFTPSGTQDVNLTKVAGTAQTARDWSLDLAKLQNLDIATSALAALLESITVQNFPADYPDAATLAKVEAVRVLLATTLTVKALVASSATLSNVNNSNVTGTILASNANRRGALFFNDDTAVTGATLKLKFGATASATSFSVAIPPQGYYELPQPVYTGVIDGIASANTGACRVTEIA